MSTFDDILTKLKSFSNPLAPKTSLTDSSKTDDILSRFESITYNFPPRTRIPDTFDPEDIRTYPLNDIMKCGKFSAFERKQEYRRRGKSPSGVIDGEYNDMYRGNDEYNDTLRDWEADA